MTSSILHHLKISLPSHPFPPSTPLNAVVMCSGAGGGYHGPAGLYPLLSSTLPLLPSLPILTATLDYTEPSYMPCSLHNLSDCLSYLRSTHSVQRVIFIGWSFGGGVVVGGAGQDLLRRRKARGDTKGEVVGIVTVGTQTAGTEAIRWIDEGGMEALFIHGGADTCLTSRCSRQLFDGFRGEGKELVIYEGDDHGCSQHRKEMKEMVQQWCVRVFSKRQTVDEAAIDKENSSQTATQK